MSNARKKEGAPFRFHTEFMWNGMWALVIIRMAQVQYGTGNDLNVWARGKDHYSLLCILGFYTHSLWDVQRGLSVCLKMVQYHWSYRLGWITVGEWHPSLTLEETTELGKWCRQVLKGKQKGEITLKFEPSKCWKNNLDMFVLASSSANYPYLSPIVMQRWVLNLHSPRSICVQKLGKCCLALVPFPSWRIRVPFGSCPQIGTGAQTAKTLDHSYSNWESTKCPCQFGPVGF